MTSLGEASERYARSIGFDNLEDALRNGAVVFKAWTDVRDVQYVRGGNGALKTLDGNVVGTPSRDKIDDFAQHACMTLDFADIEALVQCLVLGSAVMRERIMLATPEDQPARAEESERAQAFASRLACQAVVSKDWVV